MTILSKRIYNHPCRCLEAGIQLVTELGVEGSAIDDEGTNTSHVANEPDAGSYTNRAVWHTAGSRGMWGFGEKQERRMNRRQFLETWHSIYFAMGNIFDDLVKLKRKREKRE